DGGRDPSRDLDGGTIAYTNSVTIEVEPSDKGAAVLAAINLATKSIHMEMYLLSDDFVINALVAKKNAGIDVRVILNQTFPDSAGSNTATYNQLKAAGVSVVWAPSGFQYTHAKTVVIDAKSALIMTMNLTQSSATQNREYIATDTDPADVADAE